jgi:hypothetical protein
VSSLQTFLRDNYIEKPASKDLGGYSDLRTMMVPGHRHGPQPAGAARDAKYEQCCRPHGLRSLD